MHPVSNSCIGEPCVMCQREKKSHQTIRGVSVDTSDDREYATHKVGEEIAEDDPNPARHNLVAYVCCKHFREVFGDWACG